MEDLEKVFSPPGVKLTSMSFYKFENSPKNIHLTFKNRTYYW